MLLAILAAALIYFAYASAGAAYRAINSADPKTGLAQAVLWIGLLAMAAAAAIAWRQGAFVRPWWMGLSAAGAGAILGWINVASITFIPTVCTQQLFIGRTCKEGQMPGLWALVVIALAGTVFLIWNAVDNGRGPRKHAPRANTILLSFVAGVVLTQCLAMSAMLDGLAQEAAAVHAR